MTSRQKPMTEQVVTRLVSSKFNTTREKLLSDAKPKRQDWTMLHVLDGRNAQMYHNAHGHTGAVVRKQHQDLLYAKKNFDDRVRLTLQESQREVRIAQAKARRAEARANEAGYLLRKEKKKRPKRQWTPLTYYEAYHEMTNYEGVAYGDEFTYGGHEYELFLPYLDQVEEFKHKNLKTCVPNPRPVFEEFVPLPPPKPIQTHKNLNELLASVLPDDIIYEIYAMTRPKMKYELKRDIRNNSSARDDYVIHWWWKIYQDRNVRIVKYDLFQCMHLYGFRHHYETITEEEIGSHFEEEDEDDHEPRVFDWFDDDIDGLDEDQDDDDEIVARNFDHLDGLPLDIEMVYSRKVVVPFYRYLFDLKEMIQKGTLTMFLQPIRISPSSYEEESDDGEEDLDTKPVPLFSKFSVIFAGAVTAYYAVQASVFVKTKFDKYFIRSTVHKMSLKIIERQRNERIFAASKTFEVEENFASAKITMETRYKSRMYDANIKRYIASETTNLFCAEDSDVVRYALSKELWSFLTFIKVPHMTFMMTPLVYIAILRTMALGLALGQHVMERREKLEKKGYLPVFASSDDDDEIVLLKKEPEEGNDTWMTILDLMDYEYPRGSESRVKKFLEKQGFPLAFLDALLNAYGYYLVAPKAQSKSLRSILKPLIMHTSIIVAGLFGLRPSDIVFDFIKLAEDIILGLSEIIPSSSKEETFYNSDLFKNGFSIFKKIVSAVIASQLGSVDLFRRVQEFLYKSGVETGDIFVSCLHFIRQVVTSGYAWYQGKDWELIFSGDAYTEWYDRAYTFVQMLDNKIAERVSKEFGMKLIEDLDDIVEKGRSLMLQSSIKTIAFPRIKAMLDALKEKRSTLSVSLIMSTPRPTPLGVQVFGGTSVAKSDVMHVISSSIQQWTGKGVADPNRNYNVDPAQDHDNGFSEGMDICIYDEVSAVNPKVAVDASKDLKRIMCYINSMPMTANRPDIDTKGKLLFNFTAVIISTNIRDLLAKELMTHPAAIWRRLAILVEVDIHPDYSIVHPQGMRALDLPKLNADNKNIRDVQLFKVYWRSPSGDPHTITESLISPSKIHYGGFKKKVIGESGVLIEVDETEEDIKNYGFIKVYGGWFLNHVGFQRAFKFAFDNYQKGQKIACDNQVGLYKKQICKTCGILLCNEHITPSSLNVSILPFVCLTGVISLFSYKAFQKFFKHDVTFMYGVDWLAKCQLRPISSIILLNKDLMREQVKTVVAEGLQNVQSICRRPMKMALAALASIGLLVLLKRIYEKYIYEEITAATKVYFGGKEIEIAYNEGQESKPYYYPIQPMGSEFRRVVVYASDCFTGRARDTTLDKFKKIIENNIYYVDLSMMSRTKKNGANAVHIYNQYFAFNYHSVFGTIDKNEEVEITFNRNNEDLVGPKIKNQRVTKTNCRTFGQDNDLKDITYVLIPSSHQAPNILEFVRESVDGYELNINDLFLLVVRPEGDAHVHKYIPVKELKRDPHGKNYDIGGNHMVTQKGFTFRTTIEHPFQNGDSGGLLVCLSPSGYGILGFMCGFNGSLGFAIPFPMIKGDDIINCQQLIPTHNATPIGDEVEIFPSCSDFGIAQHLVGPTSGAVFLGSVNGLYRESKSNFYKSILHPDVKNFLHKDYGIPILRARTIDDEINQSKIFIDPLLTAGATLSDVKDRVEPSLDMCMLCFDDYNQSWMLIPVPDIKSGPLNLKQALNSAIPFNRLKMSTSAGFPLKGKKTDFCIKKTVVVDGKEETYYELKPEVLADFNRWKAQYIAGLAGRPIFTAHKKDEIKSLKKIAEGRERMFNGSPMYYSILCRQYLMPVLVFIQTHPDEFEHAVGINCMSSQWASIYNKISKSKYHFHGDFAQFDQEHLRTFLLLFINLIMMIIDKYMDYTPEAKSIVFRLLNDGVFAVILLRNDLFLFPKGFCSGHIITIFVNCFITSMYMRLAWYTIMIARWRRIGAAVTLFRMGVYLRTYGDDNIVGSNDKDFNFSSVREALAVYGLKYTPADKSDAQDITFYPLSQLQFLKRTFLPCKLRGQDVVLCPLEVDSIWKSLAFTDCEKSAERHQMASNLCDAHKQFWFHGDNMFHEQAAILKEIASKNEIFLGSEDSQATLKWYSSSQLEDSYFDATINIFFT